MSKAPDSYENAKRPPLLDAVRAEGDMTIKEALISLERKGYFTPRPRPWKMGFHDRGLGRGDFAVLDCFGDVVAENLDKVDVELIVAAVNAYKP